MVGFLNSILIVKPALLFLDTQVSLAPTHVSKLVGPSVCPLVTLSDFQSLVATPLPTTSALLLHLEHREHQSVKRKVYFPKVYFSEMYPT